MGTQYDQLSDGERKAIARMLASGQSQRRIAAVLGRAPSTIGRELRRNSQGTRRWQTGRYDPDRAAALTERRRRRGRGHKLARQPALRAYVRDRLAMGWSPEQIAGRLARQKGCTIISHESIYRFIYHRVAQKDYWNRLLPRRKHRRGQLGMRGGGHSCYIKHRVPIASRSQAANRRTQAGHWEGDLMLFRKYGQAVLVAHERRSRITKTLKQPSKTAQDVLDNLEGLFAGLPEALRRSLTLDNGSEFAFHYKLADRCGLKTFFCDTHSPWQKGGIENAIGRIRRSLPRKTDLDMLTQKQLDRIAERYNHTPRKCLDFKTPSEVFNQLFKKAVALET
jgi:IS30 family transposase